MKINERIKFSWKAHAACLQRNIYITMATIDHQLVRNRLTILSESFNTILSFIYVSFQLQLRWLLNQRNWYWPTQMRHLAAISAVQTHELIALRSRWTVAAESLHRLHCPPMRCRSANCETTKQFQRDSICAKKTVRSWVSWLLVAILKVTPSAASSLSDHAWLSVVVCL